AQRVRKLVDAAKQGDRGALEELYLIHFDRIYSYLHVTVGNRPDAEDLTTQTFLKMLESIGKFRWGSAPFSAWLFRIAHNLAMDHFRSEARGRGQAGRSWGARRAVPDPLRPHLQLPARDGRQSPGRRGPHDADLSEDARVDREVPLGLGAVLGVALPDRAQPGDGPL